MKKNIRVYWGSSAEYGGCNACDSFISENSPPRKHQVLVIDFLTRALSFRLCTNCAVLLKEQVDAKINLTNDNYLLDTGK